MDQEGAGGEAEEDKQGLHCGDDCFESCDCCDGFDCYESQTQFLPIYSQGK